MWFFVYYFTFIDNYNKIYDLYVLSILHFSKAYL